MKAIYRLQPDLLASLDHYRGWLFTDRVQQIISQRMALASPRFLKEGRPEHACSVEALAAIDHGAHEGFPGDFYGIDLNYKNVQNESAQWPAEFFEEIRQVNRALDEKLQNALGARSCALKAFYPEQGYIAWHTNWNAPGYVVIFTYSPTGRGYWRHIDPTGSSSRVPNPERLVHIPDAPGWHCKVGYFGAREQSDRLVWHCAYSSEKRVTVSYLVQDRAVWEDMVEEIADYAGGSESETHFARPVG